MIPMSERSSCTTSPVTHTSPIILHQHSHKQQFGGQDTKAGMVQTIAHSCHGAGIIRAPLGSPQLPDCASIPSAGCGHCRPAWCPSWRCTPGCDATEFTFLPHHHSRDRIWRPCLVESPSPLCLMRGLDQVKDHDKMWISHHPFPLPSSMPLI